MYQNLFLNNAYFVKDEKKIFENFYSQSLQKFSRLRKFLKQQQKLTNSNHRLNRRKKSVPRTTELATNCKRRREQAKSDKFDGAAADLLSSDC